MGCTASSEQAKLLRVRRNNAGEGRRKVVCDVKHVKTNVWMRECIELKKTVHCSGFYQTA